VTVFSVTNEGMHGYIQHSFDVVATDTSTAVQFAGRTPLLDFLDDVSVTDSTPGGDNPPAPGQSPRLPWRGASTPLRPGGLDGSNASSAGAGPGALAASVGGVSVGAPVNGLGTATPLRSFGAAPPGAAFISMPLPSPTLRVPIGVIPAQPDRAAANSFFGASAVHDSDTLDWNWTRNWLTPRPALDWSDPWEDLAAVDSSF
jgi:hypothetical protein